METGRGARGEKKRTDRGKKRDSTVPPHYPVAFVDSSAIVALVDADDVSHGAAVEAYQSLVSSGYRLFATNHVIVEAYALLISGVGPDVARRWLRDNRLAVYTTNEDDENSAREMVIGAAESRTVTLTDAISIVVMERLGVADAFAVDPRFLAELS